MNQNRGLIISILVVIGLCSCEQRSNSKTRKVTIKPDIVNLPKNNDEQLSLNHDLERYIYTDTAYTYTPSKEEKIIIQNSLPKGGSIDANGTPYFDSLGKKYAFSVFWTRIINKTSTSVEFNINCPADSFAIFTPPNSYLKLFLPTNTFTYNKLSLYNYGLTEVKSFLDTNFNKTAKLQKIINPNEEYVFYVAALTYKAVGTPRAALILKERNLYYRMSLSPNGSGIVPFGNIAFKHKIVD